MCSNKIDGFGRAIYLFSDKYTHIYQKTCFYYLLINMYMKLFELFDSTVKYKFTNDTTVERKNTYNEGKVKNIDIDRKFDRQNNAGSAPTLFKKQMNYDVIVNGKVWRDFATELEAMRAANSIYSKNPRLRISVLPKKKDPKVP